MQVLSNGKVRRTAKERAKLVKKFRKSDLSLKRFSEQEDVPASSLKNWLEDKRFPDVGAVSKRRKRKDAGGFVDIPVSSSDKKWEMEIELPSGAILRLQG